MISKRSHKKILSSKIKSHSSLKSEKSNLQWWQLKLKNMAPHVLSSLRAVKNPKVRANSKLDITSFSIFPLALVFYCLVSPVKLPKFSCKLNILLFFRRIMIYSQIICRKPYAKSHPLFKVAAICSSACSRAFVHWNGELPIWRIKILQIQPASGLSTNLPYQRHISALVCIPSRWHPSLSVFGIPVEPWLRSWLVKVTIFLFLLPVFWAATPKISPVNDFLRNLTVSSTISLDIHILPCLCYYYFIISYLRLWDALYT